MAARDVPEPWSGLLIKARFIDRRNGRASMTQLANASGVHASTIGAVMYGTRKPQAETLDQLVAALATGMRLEESSQPARRRRQLRETVFNLADIALNQAAPFEPHPDADLLDNEERNAVNELIRLLAKPKRGDARGGGRRLSVAPDTNGGALAADPDDDAAGESESYNEP